ncbi:MAG TPA: dihydrolipoyl dehydrogenase [Candidatus Dormibacteraeota bacterium]
MPEGYDIAIVGGGPGGYVAALRATQLGARVTLVERDRVGGTCLLRGCIPTKALLQSSELYSLVQRGGEYGVVAKQVGFDWPAAQKRKAKVVEQLVTGVEGLLKRAGVDTIGGHAKLTKGGVEVDGKTIAAKDVIVATGSVPSRIPIDGAEHTIDSDAILELAEPPKRLVVIGGGVVGMEFGAMFAALGSEVTVLEMLPQVLPMVEGEVAQAYRRHFEGLGAKVHTESQVKSVSRHGKALSVRFNDDEVAADVVLLAAGRRAFTEGLGAEELGVQLERGRVIVDSHLRTAADHVFAIGDVIGGIMLAHVASYEGVCAVENIAGHRDRIPDYHAAPNCVYTDPEIANVGLGENDARAAGHEVKVGRFPFAASGRALTLGETQGFVKVVADARDGRVLGVHMVGPRVTELIAEATLAVQQGVTLDELDLTMHAHPTLAESFMEAALAADDRAIHIANRRPAPVKEETLPVARQVRDEKPAATFHVDGKLELKKGNHDELLEMYRLMTLIRRFEERAQLEYTHAKIGGYCHLNLGEEATVVGAVLPLKPGDHIYTSYREHGHAIARGIDPKAVMAELFGRESGTSHGRGGSMHIFDMSRHFMGGYGIVGGHLPLAAGAGFAIKYRRQPDVSFCMFGDGAVNIGAFHESLNYSKVAQLPVVWFCVNNQYGMGTAVARSSAVPEVYKRACAYDIEAIRIDGMDVLEVLQATQEVVEKTRADSQPRFIEAVCYRFKGHSVVDPDKYRSDDEKQKWLREDPVRLFESRLVDGKVATPEELKAVQEQVLQQVEEAVAFADQSADPPTDELYRYLYSGEFETVKT